jgi:aminopeptidase YwaD
MNYRTILLPVIAAILVSACSKPVEDDRPMTIRVAEDVRLEFDEDLALATVAFLDQHIRWPGNVGFDASIDYIVAELEAAGYVKDPMGFSDERLTYRVEEYPMDEAAWQPLGASLWIDGDSKALMSFATNRNMLAYNSYSTTEGGVLLDVVDVGDGSSEALDAVDVRGKVVLADREIDGLFEDAVVSRGAAGVLAYTMPAYTQPEKNREAVQFGDIADNDGAQSWGIVLSFSAQEKLRSALGNGDVRVKVSTRVQWIRAATERTVVAEVRGSELPDERFVFSAHLQEPGANDNASGVAAQLEMARVTANLVSAEEVDPKRTITYLWGDEFVSTKRFVTQDPGRREFILWAISMDMVGQDTSKTGGTFLIEKIPDPSAIWARGEESFSEWGGQPISKDQLMPHYLNDVVYARALEQAATNGWVVKTNPFEGGSDHVPFIEAGIPSLLLWHFTDQYYHTDLDRLEMVSADEMKNVGVTALTTALTLTSADAITAQQLIEEVQQAAIDRIRTETSLSVAAIRGGGTAAAEREILETWADWYDDALVAMQDIEVSGASAEVRRSIDTARIKVGATLAVSSTLLSD